MTKIKIMILVLLAVLFNFKAFAADNCLLCGTTSAVESQQPGGGDPCEDLYAASCLNSEGNSKYKGKFKKLNDELAANVKKAKDQAATSSSSSKSSDLVLGAIENEGIEINPAMRQQVANAMTGGIEMMYMPQGNSKDYYVKSSQCQNEVYEISTIPYYNMNDVGELEKLAKRAEALHTKYNPDVIRLLAKDLSVFMATEYSGKCSAFQFSQTPNAVMQVKKEDNLALFKACENSERVKRKAIDLYRKEGSEGYQAAAEEFVKENLLPEIVHATQPSQLTAPGDAPKTPEQLKVEALRVKIFNSAMMAGNTCAKLTTQLDTVARAAAMGAQNAVTKSKPTVEYLIDQTYTDSRKAKAEAYFKGARGSIQDVVSKVVKEPSKRAEIIDGYDKLKLYWMEKPKPDQYKKDKSGLLVLDETKFDMMDTRLMAFSDPSLSYFSQANAFYMPQVTFGKTAVAETVNMMPSFVQDIDANPSQFLAIVAHEAGHKVGPMISKLNGYDLSKEYSSLLSCYGNPRSIKMTPHQADETVADYFSSEVLAREISKLPPNERREKLMSSMSAFCTFSDASSHAYSCKGNHPEPSLRVSGVYGANPSIRKALGCSKESSKYKSCGLAESILDIPESQPANENGERAVPAQNQRGVK